DESWQNGMILVSTLLSLLLIGLSARAMRRDAAARRRGEADLRLRNAALGERQNFRSAIIDTMQGALIAARAGRIVLVNPAGLRLVGGRDADSLLGAPVVGIFEADDAEAVAARLDAPEGGSPVKARIRRDGGPVPVEIRVSTFTDSGGPVRLIELGE